MKPMPITMSASKHGEPFELLVTVNGGTATKRTRNRVREGGPRFWSVPNPNRSDDILLWSPVTGWFGWLPKSEIAITKI